MEMFSQIARFLEPQRTAYPRALDKFFDGQKDAVTLELLAQKGV